MACNGIEYFLLEGTYNDRLVQLPFKLVLVQLNMAKGKKNAFMQQYENGIKRIPIYLC